MPADDEVEHRHIDERHAEDTRSHEVYSGVTEKRCFPALYSALWDTCRFPVLGVVPVRDRPRTEVSPLKCGHHGAPAVPRKGSTTEESTKTQNPFLPVCVFTFVWGFHTESPANSLQEVSRVSLQLTAEAWGPLPSSGVGVRQNKKHPLQCGSPLGEFHVDIRPSVHHRSPTRTDLRPVVLKRDDRKHRHWSRTASVPKVLGRYTKSKQQSKKSEGKPECNYRTATKHNV